MAIVYNAKEVLEMAQQIERNGAAFYRKAAGLKEESREFLLKLAGMEDEHEKTFAQMAGELGAEEQKQTAFDPDNETQLYLDAMADAHGGEGAPSIADSLTGEETVEKILNTAIELERKSILFYVGLKDMVPARFGQDKIDHIIDEEKSHVAVLAKHLKTVKEGAQ